MSPTTTALLQLVTADREGDHDLPGEADRAVQHSSVSGVLAAPGAAGVPRQRSRQAVTVVRLCPVHGRRARLGLLEPYVARLEDGWGHLVAVSARVGAAAPGQAAGEDLVFLDGVAQDLQQVARLLEGERSPRWQGLAAVVGTRGDALKDLLRPHLY